MLLEGQDCPSGDKHAKEEEELIRQEFPPAGKVCNMLVSHTQQQRDRFKQAAHVLYW